MILGRKGAYFHLFLGRKGLNLIKNKNLKVDILVLESFKYSFRKSDTEWKQKWNQKWNKNLKVDILVLIKESFKYRLRKSDTKWKQKWNQNLKVDKEAH